MRKNLGIFIFEGVETLDVAGPFEVFSVADELFGFELYSAVTFAETKAAVRTVNGLSINPTYDFTNVPPLDVLIIPGGEGVRRAVADPALLAFIERLSLTAQYVLTVCSGALLAAHLGWLKNKQYCTHHLLYTTIAAIEPDGLPRQDLRFTGDGKLYTSAGVSAGIDLALYIVALVNGAETSQQVAGYLEYTAQGH